MATQEQPDREPAEPTPGEAAEVVKAEGRRRSFARLRRELNDEELSSPAVQKMLLDEIERLETDNSDLKQYRSKFHETDKSCAVLGEKHRRFISHEIIHSGCLAIGSVALGAVPSLWNSQPAGYICLAASAVLIVCSLVAKVMRL